MFVVEFVAVETPAVTAEGGEEGVEVGVVDAADAVAVEHPLGLDLLPPPPDWTEEGGVPHGQLLPRLDPRLGSQLDGGRRVADWLQVGQAGVGEEGKGQGTLYQLCDNRYEIGHYNCKIKTDRRNIEVEE